ncbi:SHOCT domain-containing protein [Roseomonas indoligenes]|uniref:SHOCT domain-containing protein n=1 Tax=Roseomonas indoligenes TaxID=2820811 RepID=A0A940N0L2_9PROT|nr:SHOCT domain-containing protein [Pararoseomonas indoligenes]MBP0494319.1 SHOCT domain-containing protein [Pararoseomonas indoligenes]
MQDITPEAQERVQEIAARHGVSPDAAMTLLRALSAGGGTMAQFSHPELGGMGQWSRGGMIMVGDMFNTALKARVDALCTELSALFGGNGPWQAGSTPAASSWWPAELGSPAWSGAQNDMRYAYFPASNRLAVSAGGQVALYDTAEHRIGGVSQQQGGSQVLTLSSDRGPVRLEDLRRLQASEGAASAPPAPAPSAPPHSPAPSETSDPLTLIERLADLRGKGVLSDEEFTAKKAELLRRL